MRTDGTTLLLRIEKVVGVFERGKGVQQVFSFFGAGRLPLYFCTRERARRRKALSGFPVAPETAALRITAEQTQEECRWHISVCAAATASVLPLVL